jgi:hypothetical protein
MKKILLATTLALVSASSAFAFTHDTGLNSADLSEIRSLVPSADLSGLSASQIDALDRLIASYNGENDDETAGRIQLILSRG